MTVSASPAVRAYAFAKGADITAIGTASERSTISREDVDSALRGVAEGGNSDMALWDVDHAAYGPVTVEPLTPFARLAAANLAGARAIPQVTHHDKADMRAVEKLRLQAAGEKPGAVKLTALAYHVKALAKCLKEFPRFNSSLSPDGGSLTVKQYIHIGIAVDAPHGLVVPVIRNADRKNLLELASEVSDLADRARARIIRASEIGGASMSISNLGGIGGTGFTPIVNPPEVAILGLGRTALEAEWVAGTLLPVPKLPISLSYDHRVVNGADAARFVRYFADLLADPRRLLL